jgi:hypothetical protein
MENKISTFCIPGFLKTYPNKAYNALLSDFLNGNHAQKASFRLDWIVLRTNLNNGFLAQPLCNIKNNNLIDYNSKYDQSTSTHRTLPHNSCCKCNITFVFYLTLLDRKT